MPELRPFNENSRCPKCGHRFTVDRFEPASEMNFFGHSFGHTEDHISRTCKRCQYAWKEAPLDAAKKDAP